MCDKPMIVSVSSLLPQEYHDMKAKAVALLDLLDDIHQNEKVIILDAEIEARMLAALNESTLVDE